MSKLAIFLTLLFLFIPVSVFAQAGPGIACQRDSDCQSQSCIPSDIGNVCAAGNPPQGNNIVPNPPGGNSGNNGGSSGDMLGDLRSIINGNSQTQKFGTLGGLISQVLDIIFMVAGFLMFVLAAMGIFQYITAGGNKEGLAKARNRITWAIIGFVFIMVSFLLSGYIQQLIPSKNVGVCSSAEIANLNCGSQNPPKTCIKVNDQAQCQ